MTTRNRIIRSRNRALATALLLAVAGSASAVDSVGGKCTSKGNDVAFSDGVVYREPNTFDETKQDDVVVLANIALDKATIAKAEDKGSGKPTTARKSSCTSTTRARSGRCTTTRLAWRPTDSPSTLRRATRLPCDDPTESNGHRARNDLQGQAVVRGPGTQGARTRSDAAPRP